ncbi:MAG: PAS domain S-box protein [Chryseolinea sp.]
MLKILHLEDEQSDADLVRRELKNGNIQCELLWVVDEAGFKQALTTFSPDVILSDHSLPGFNSLDALKMVKELGLDTPFILITATVSEEFAVAIIKNGAEDYVLKDRMQRLPKAVQSAIEKRNADREIKFHHHEVELNERKFRGLIENSNDLIGLLDKNLKVLYQSSNYQRITGWSPEEIENNKPATRVHPDDLANVRDRMDEVFAAPGKSVPIHYRLKHKDGHYLWLEGMLANMLDDESIKGIISNMRDVSDSKNAELQLRKAHGQILFHLENSPLGFIEWDRNMEVISWSKMAQNIFGWEDGEFAANHLTAYGEVYKEDKEWVTVVLKQLLSGQIERNHLQCRNCRKDQSVIWCEWFNSVLKNDEGEVVAIMSLVQDITERKAADAAVQTVKANLTAIVENTADYIYSLDRDLKYITFNTPLKNIMKYTYDLNIVEGMKVHGFLGPENIEEAQQWEETYAKVMEGKSQQFVKDYSTPTDRVFVNFSINPILENGDVIGVSCFARDVTPQYLAEEKLIRSEMRFRSLIENNYDAILIRDRDFKMTYCSPSALRMLGYNRDEQNKMDLWDGFHPDDIPHVEQIKVKLFHNPGKPYFLTVRKKHKSGHYIWMEGVMVNMLENPGVLGIVSNFRDITERKGAEEEKTNLVSQLIDQNNDLMQFSFIASHNLRSPVASLLGLVSLFNMDDIKGESANLIPYVKKTAMNLDEVIKDLSRILSVRTGDVHGKESVNILTMIDEIRQSFEVQLHACKIEFLLSHVEVDTFHTSRIYLHSILYNLISNAIKFRSPKRDSIIEIKTWSDHGDLSLTVRDNGLGLDLRQFGEKVFGLYHRFHLDVEGKGLGLYMVKTQVQMLNGTIHIESKPSVGTLFTIKFRLDKNDQPAVNRLTKTERQRI